MSVLKDMLAEAGVSADAEHVIKVVKSE